MNCNFPSPENNLGYLLSQSVSVSAMTLSANCTISSSTIAGFPNNGSFKPCITYIVWSVCILLYHKLPEKTPMLTIGAHQHQAIASSCVSCVKFTNKTQFLWDCGHRHPRVYFKFYRFVI